MTQSLDSITIALIALPPTLSAAMSLLLTLNGGACVTEYAAIENDCEQMDVMITGIDYFVAHLDYFLPRKKKVAIIREMNATAVDSTPPVTVLHLGDTPERTFRRITEMCGQRDNAHAEHTLTSREVDVLREIATGRTNKEIADVLNISVNTVITHRKNITQKLGIRSASGLSLYAIMNGLI